MVYAIWAISFFVGAALESQGNHLGIPIIIAGFLVGSRVKDRKDREDQARRTAKQLRNDRLE